MSEKAGHGDGGWGKQNSVSQRRRMVKSSIVILKEYPCTVTLKCGQSHINTVKTIQFCQLCKSKSVNGYSKSLFQKLV